MLTKEQIAEFLDIPKEDEEDKKKYLSAKTKENIIHIKKPKTLRFYVEYKSPVIPEGKYKINSDDPKDYTNSNLIVVETLDHYNERKIIPIKK